MLSRFFALLAVAALCAALIVAPAALARDVLVGPAQATDGDSLVIGDQRVRLHGVDAFEREQTCPLMNGRLRACGGEATRALAQLIAGATVVCAQRDTDSHGRIVAQCRAGEIDLGAAMVRRGHALAFLRYSADYAPDEAAARAAGIGVWAPGVTFTPPWDWRRAQRAPHAALAARAQPIAQGCAIKGNVNRAGARIYHLPEGRDWARTRAEVIFCSETEARAAGFRAAQR
jgi:endonuclease YncB( thermonuclease family)